MPPRDNYYINKQYSANPCDSNHHWNEVTVRKIIRSEVYIGHMIQCKQGTVSYKTRKLTSKPKEEWIRVENTHEPIIDMATWQTVMDLDEKNYKPRKRTDGQTSIFTGLLKCGDCGYTMRNSVEKGKRKDGSEYYYSSFMCGTYARSGKSACTVHTIYENVLTELVIQGIRSDASMVGLKESHIANRITKMKTNQAVSYRNAYEQELKLHRQRLLKLDTIIQNLYEDRVNGVITESVFKNLMEKYENEKYERSTEASDITVKLESMKKETDDTSKWISLIKPYKNLEKLDAEILLTLIDRIVVDEPQKINGKRICDIHIYYKYVGNIEWMNNQGLQLMPTEESAVMSNAI